MSFHENQCEGLILVGHHGVSESKYANPKVRGVLITVGVFMNGIGVYSIH
jgi:hypothetical protein